VKATLNDDVLAVIAEIVGANGTTDVISNDRVTLVAARWLALSATDATSVHVPAYTIVTFMPVTVHVSVVELVTVTARPEVVVGATANVAVSKARFAGWTNVMVWAIFATVMVTVFDVAAR
jgi:hypothetical protein